MTGTRIALLLLFSIFALDLEAIPEISVVVPVYNAERFLRECLNSILNQSFKDIEVLCVDDGSLDGSLNILKEYAQKDRRIVVISHDKNCGLSAARNSGLDVAQGKYIAFCDSDDLMHPDMLKTLHRHIVENDAEVAFCNFSYIKESASPNFSKITDHGLIVQNHLLEFESVSSRLLSVCNKLYKSTSIGSNRFDTSLRSGEDVYFNIHAFGLGKKVVFTHASLYVVRPSSNSITRNPVSHRIIDSYCKSVEKVFSIKSLPMEIKLYLGKCTCGDIIQMIITHGTQGDDEFFHAWSKVNELYSRNMTSLNWFSFQCLRVHFIIGYYQQKLWKYISQYLRSSK
ncbi:MAG: glycosyltransferase [Holosporaceae bacterium]|jgi:glycosyltransferase involved in cell wall biosynthesis|nr:glycosyltransferase [Holosporaceae bacterium]